MGDSAATRVLLIEDSLGDALRVTRRLAPEFGGDAALRSANRPTTR